MPVAAIPPVIAVPLVRPLAQEPVNVSGSGAAVELKRFALQQLLPIFERHLPDRADLAKSELAQLGAAGMPPLQHTQAAQKENLPPPADLTVSEVIKRIEQITGARERENAFFEEAIKALNRKDFERARTLAIKITELSLKIPALELIEFQVARKAIENGELIEAQQIANSKLGQGWPALIYCWLVSSWLKRGDTLRVVELTNYAQAQATKLEDSAQRALVYIYLAASLAKQDVLRAFDLAEAAVKDINSAERFDLNNNRIVFRIRKPNGSTYDYGVTSGVSLLSALPTLAEDDLIRAVHLAQSLRAPEMRAFSVIATCRGVLNSRKNLDKTKKGKLATNN